MDDKPNKPPVSAKKLVANRLNGKCSHGPVTDAGKAKSAQNAYKHGLFAKRLFPNAEQRLRDGADYDVMYAGFCNHYSPVGYWENYWVEKIATEALRLARLLGFEQKILAWSAPFEARSVDRLLRYESTVNRQFMKAIDYLERLQEKRKSESTQPEPDNTGDEPSEMIQEPSATREDVVSEEPTEDSTAGNIPAASPKVPSENLEATASHGLDASEAELSSGAEESAGTNPPTEWDSLDSEDERAITEALKAEEPENWEFSD
jgi:hypothetical protein